MSIIGLILIRSIFLYYRAAFAKENAVIMVLCRNSDKDDMVKTMVNFEDKFNSKFKYPYLFLNNEDFTDEFKDAIRTVSKNVEFGKLDADEWNIPRWIDIHRMAIGIEKLAERGVIYAKSVSYRQMCRFFSGFVYRNKHMQKYDYYMRLEPGVKFLCKINYDIFEYMRKNKKDYGFVITLHEFMETIPTLWQEVMNFVEENRDILPEDTTFGYILENNEYNGCHFWDNFEVANLSFFRSELYQKYFDYLDKRGGFFYERWGDAPVHSIAVNLFMQKDRIHFFEDIGYEHSPFLHCPDIPSRRDDCECSPDVSVYNSPLSCTRQFRSEL
ncbi:Glycolipid 2-alpha-mannosyltransferase 1 [Dictyocoela roeselum]|nr:Glycolipid 2-alpha-mannosyltransferase 1 [Dictyocoela roeselum]